MTSFIMFSIMLIIGAGRMPTMAVEHSGLDPDPINRQLFSAHSFIDSIGDIRAVLGSQGKNITVCRHGDVIAVLYGAPTGSSNDPMYIKIAYSLTGGNSWVRYGPLSGMIRRIYGGVDASPDYCSRENECIFSNMEAVSG